MENIKQNVELWQEGGGVPDEEGNFETKKDEMEDDREDEMVDEIEDDLVDELVKKQYEDFPCPEVTAQQLEEDSLGVTCDILLKKHDHIIIHKHLHPHRQHSQ